MVCLLTPSIPASDACVRSPRNSRTANDKSIIVLHYYNTTRYTAILRQHTYAILEVEALMDTKLFYQLVSNEETKLTQAALNNTLPEGTFSVGTVSDPLT